MSNATPLMLGLAGGLALWRLAPAKQTATPTTTITPRNGGACVLELDPSGLVTGGARVDIAEAVTRARSAGLALLNVKPDAAATIYAAVMTAFRDAGVPIHARTLVSATRNAAPGDKRANEEKFSAFTLVTYPRGVGGSRTRFFRTDAPMTWRAARDQLVTAKVIDPNAIAPGQAGYWKLVTDTRVFVQSRAEPLPDHAEPLPNRKVKGTRDAAKTGRYAIDGGRIIVRDGQPLVRLERVDLGDARYALSPHETDRLGARLVRLLNRQGAR